MKDKKIKSFTVLLVAAAVFVLSAGPVWASTESNDDGEADGLKIVVTSLDVNDTTLKLSYRITNDSENNIWILNGLFRTGVSAEVFMDKDDQTLIIRRRLDVPFGGSGGIVYGRYGLLRTGESRVESLTLTIPVNPYYCFTSSRGARGPESATKVAVEIGYYDNDLPDKICHILEKADKIPPQKRREEEFFKYTYYFEGLLYYNKLSEGLRQRNEEIYVPYTYQWFGGEQVLQTTVENVQIPYQEKYDQIRIRDSLNIPDCSRIDIKFKPSILNYFFPFEGQQNLFSRKEKQNLQSIKTVSIVDSKILKDFVSCMNSLSPFDGIVQEINVANVVCYHEDDAITSFPIYNDDSVVIDNVDRFCMSSDILSYNTSCLRTLIPQIKPFELRVECAANIRNLWYRLRLTHKTVGTGNNDSTNKTEITYPPPNNWCDSIVRVCQTIRWSDRNIIKSFICPGTPDVKSHIARSTYAMNPNCKPNSPGDMVLLFETKAGWNQHGGPELFTFDNHDPKGGCVLLNDGTVKFIRTQEERQALRWK